MNRRFFIQAATSTLFIPHALASGHVSPTADRAGADYFFVDERFPLAHRLAAQLAGSTALTPVQGDITAIWIDRLDRASREAPLAIRGVTTESFHFCLKVMIAEHAHLDTHVSRLDRDLFLWTIRSST